jgi:hypothetical protein
LGVVFAGTGGVMNPDSVREDYEYQIEWRSLLVPAGGRIILMHFAVQAPDLASAVSLASGLMNLAIPEAFSDLSAQERAQIVNFVVPEP